VPSRRLPIQAALIRLTGAIALSTLGAALIVTALFPSLGSLT
jgi:hypothetical protein